MSGPIAGVPPLREWELVWGECAWKERTSVATSHENEVATPLSGVSGFAAAIICVAARNSERMSWLSRWSPNHRSLSRRSWVHRRPVHRRPDHRPHRGRRVAQIRRSIRQLLCRSIRQALCRFRSMLRSNPYRWCPCRPYPCCRYLIHRSGVHPLGVHPLAVRPWEVRPSEVHPSWTRRSLSSSRRRSVRHWLNLRSCRMIRFRFLPARHFPDRLRRVHLVRLVLPVPLVRPDRLLPDHPVRLVRPVRPAHRRAESSDSPPHPP